MSKGKTNGRMEAVEANNIKAMREALCDIVMLTMKVGYSIRGDVACGIIASKAKHALALPPRNCDRFGSESEMRAAFIDWYNEAYDLKGTYDEISTCELKHDVDGILHDYIEWLLAPSTEQKGEDYGRK